ncbi:MAG: hypothetical protein ABUT20_52815, partial [Bacteroidota bacterium]
MATQKEIGEILVRLNVDNANQGIDKLETNVRSLEKSLDQLGKGNPAERRKIIEQLQDTEQEILKLRESVKTDIRVIINGELAGKSIRDLQTALRTLNREMNAIGDSSSPEFLKKAQQAAVLQNRINELKQPTKDFLNQLKQVGEDGSMVSLKAKAERLRAEVEKLGPSSQEFITKTKELQQVEGRMSSLGKTIQGTSGFWSGLTAQVKQFGLLAAGYLGFSALFGQFQNAIRKSAELSDALADVQQTTGMTDAQVRKLNQSLSLLNTRTPRSELLEIAKVAGQFRVANSEIVQFTKSINQAAVVLRSEF